MRGFEVMHQEKGLRLVPLLEPIETEVSYDIGRVSLVFHYIVRPSALRRISCDWIVVPSLTRQYIVVIERSRFFL